MVMLAIAGATLAACAHDEPAAAPVSGPAVSAPVAASTTTTGSTTTATAATVPADSGPIDTSTTVAERPLAPGARRMHFEIGPIAIQPGQNNIAYSRKEIPKPDVDGYIVGIAPNLRLADGTIPGVDVIHLHHGVWLNASAHDSTAPGLPERFFAAGEEKTAMELPVGYGYAYHASDNWVVNYMIHNLYPIEQQVWITYDVDFIPGTDPAAASLQPARPIWTDVQNGSIYPVFDVIKGSGANGVFTYPTGAASAYGTGPALNTWKVDRDGVLIATAGHLHPGGLHTDLWLQRNGASAHLFQSVAHYWEPAGAVSWDVAMTATPTSWRVAVHAGDTLSTSATYDSARASWYESMGIMVVWMADAPAKAEAAGPDPFASAVDAPGQLTHGHLAENNNHGGAADATYKNALQQPSEPAAAEVRIEGYVYAQGDMLAGTAIPTVVPGGTITFDNIDAPLNNGVWHTITACAAPCNASTGVAYPLADAAIPFDSGQLGVAGPPTAGRVTWTTPADLPEGTYTYFCRIHPAMRGAFRIEANH